MSIAQHHYGSEPAPRAKSSLSLSDRFAKFGFLASVAFLVFVLGSLSSDHNWPASQWVRDASSAAHALIAQGQMNGRECPPFLWFPESTSGRGLVRRNTELMQPGYTLYTSADAAQAILLDDEGHVAHRWVAPFSKVWPAAAQINGWLDDRSIYIRAGACLSQRGSAGAV